MSVKIQFSEAAIGEETEYYFGVTEMVDCSECGTQHAKPGASWYLNINSKSDLKALSDILKSFADIIVGVGRDDSEK